MDTRSEGRWIHGLWSNGYRVRFCIIEVGARSLISKSTYDGLKQLKGTQRNGARSLREAAVKTSCWLCINCSEKRTNYHSEVAPTG